MTTLSSPTLGSDSVLSFRKEVSGSFSGVSIISSADASGLAAYSTKLIYQEAAVVELSSASLQGSAEHGYRGTPARPAGRISSMPAALLGAAAPGADPAQQAASETSQDPLTEQYICFIASMDPDVQAGRRDIGDKIAELKQAMTQPHGEGGGAANNESARGVSASEISAAYQNGAQSVHLHAQASLNAQAHLAAEVTLADGTKVSVQADLQVSMQAEVDLRRRGENQQADPLALDIDRDGKISLTDVEHGAAFDINGDGRIERSAFVSGQDVFLAMDRNGDGQINSGKELFGDQNGAANGFIELVKLDENGDGVINEKDSAFGALKGVKLGSDGLLVCSSLADLGVDEIALAYQYCQLAAEGGNTISQIGSYGSQGGTQYLAADVVLNYQA